MASEFGRTWQFYNNGNWRTGERVHKVTNCPLSEREEGGNRFWSVCCLGRKLENGYFEFKIRQELQMAFEETGILESYYNDLQGEDLMPNEKIQKSFLSNKLNYIC
jgi:hypothetical protein